MTASPPKDAYQKFARQKHDSVANRGIPFLLTFGEWWQIWNESGHWPERGSSPLQYCMARHGDQGAYAVGNVRITTGAENRAEQNYRTSEETKEKLRIASLGNTNTLGLIHSPESRAKISASLTGNSRATGNRFNKSPDAIARTRAAHLGCVRSETARANIRAAAQLREIRKREKRSQADG
jgi:hypothetical protein